MRVADHIVEARRSRMADYLRRHAYASLHDVCTAHRISQATARRDLVALESENRIVRTYGGALAEYQRRFPTFRDRLQERKAIKRRIAAVAVKEITPGSTVYLDLGTTVHAVAEELVRRAIPDVKVVTNSLPVADLLADADGVRVFLLGGELLPRQAALLGETAERAVSAYTIDAAFFSAEAADAKGLWNSQQQLVNLQRAALDRARRRVLCLDASKFSRHAESFAGSFLAGWKEFDLLITNASPTQANRLTSIKTVSA